MYSNGHVDNIYENMVEYSGIAYDLSFRESKRWCREIMHFNDSFIAQIFASVTNNKLVLNCACLGL